MGSDPVDFDQFVWKTIQVFCPVTVANLSVHRLWSFGAQIKDMVFELRVLFSSVKLIIGLKYQANKNLCLHRAVGRPNESLHYINQNVGILFLRRLDILSTVKGAHDL